MSMNNSILLLLNRLKIKLAGLGYSDESIENHLIKDRERFENLYPMFNDLYKNGYPDYFKLEEEDFYLNLGKIDRKALAILFNWIVKVDYPSMITHIISKSKPDFKFDGSPIMLAIRKNINKNETWKLCDDLTRLLPSNIEDHLVAIITNTNYGWEVSLLGLIVKKYFKKDEALFNLSNSIKKNSSCAAICMSEFGKIGYREEDLKFMESVDNLVLIDSHFEDIEHRDNFQQILFKERNAALKKLRKKLVK